MQNLPLTTPEPDRHGSAVIRAGSSSQDSDSTKAICHAFSCRSADGLNQ
jgi:hypothetical protein